MTPWFKPIVALSDLDAFVAVVAVFNLAALTEQGVSLVKEQAGAAIVFSVENTA